MPVVLPDACQEAVEVGAGELPAERPGGGVVVLLEGEDLGGEFIEVFEVVGGEELALDDGEVDLSRFAMVHGALDRRVRARRLSAGRGCFGWSSGPSGCGQAT